MNDNEVYNNSIELGTYAAKIDDRYQERQLKLGLVYVHVY